MKASFAIRFAGICWLIALSQSACAPPLGDDAGGTACGDGMVDSRDELDLTLVPSTDDGAAPSILHIHARAPTALDPDRLWLIDGDVGSGHLRQLAADDPSLALRDRFVPATSYALDDGVAIAPSGTLDPGARYTVAAGGAHGPVIASPIDITDDNPWPTAARLFPPDGRGAGRAFAIWCGGGPLVASPPAVADNAEATSAQGVLGDPTRGAHCTRVDVESAAGMVHASPPTAVDPASASAAPPEAASPEAASTEPTALLEPTAMSDDAALPPLVALPCSEGQLRVGPGCATVYDDRMLLAVPETPLLWSLSDGAGLDFVAAAFGGTLVAHPLIPSSTMQLVVTTIDVAASAGESSIIVHTSAPTSHVVINEVLANAIGPEPEQEWIELYNDGLAPADLDGWQLKDIGGIATLPPATLAPGAYALLVNEAYDEGGQYDPPPPGDAQIIRLHKLGKNGLSNEGEPLALLRPDGSTVTSFPAIPKPKAGRSVLRRSPKSTIHTPDAFVLSEQDASTPAQPNF